MASSTSRLGLRVATVVVFIIRPDSSGWFSDAFYIHWHNIPQNDDNGTIDLWEASNWNKEVRKQAARSDAMLLFDRAMSESERQAIPLCWIRGNEAELKRIFDLIMQLYVRHKSGGGLYTWKYKAINPASRGGFETNFDRFYQRNLKIHPRKLNISPALLPLLRGLQHHFQFMGMNWEYNIHTQVFLDDSFEPMIARWGEKWRGNYRLHTPTLDLTASIPTSLSQHERLELTLQLRDWLQDKVSLQQSAKWLSEIPD